MPERRRPATCARSTRCRRQRSRRMSCLRWSSLPRLRGGQARAAVRPDVAAAAGLSIGAESACASRLSRSRSAETGATLASTIAWTCFKSSSRAFASGVRDAAPPPRALIIALRRQRDDEVLAGPVSTHALGGQARPPFGLFEPDSPREVRGEQSLGSDNGWRGPQSDGHHCLTLPASWSQK